jgi:hypothetical protein
VVRPRRTMRRFRHLICTMGLLSFLFGDCGKQPVSQSSMNKNDASDGSGPDLLQSGAIAICPMKNLDDKIIMVFYGVFGGGLGFLIYTFGLGGMKVMVMNRAAKPWNGMLALIICVVLGFGWGIVSYKFKDREFGGGGSSLFDDQATALLFTKRLMVLLTCVAGVYFMWQLAKGLK